MPDEPAFTELVERHRAELRVHCYRTLGSFEQAEDLVLDWTLVDDEVHSHFNQVLAAMGGFLSGRVTYELMAGFWPTADQDPASTGPMVEFARIWRDMPKIVYSRTLETTDWHTTVVRDVVPAEVRALQARPGGDLALGGADLAAAFMRYDLIDEYLLYVHPIAIGRGKPLFPRWDHRTRLRLAQTRTFGQRRRPPPLRACPRRTVDDTHREHSPGALTGSLDGGRADRVRRTCKTCNYERPT